MQSYKCNLVSRSDQQEGLPHKKKYLPYTVFLLVKADFCLAYRLIWSASCLRLTTLHNISRLFLQALGFPGDDLTAVPWQRPRCNEGPLFLLSSQLPAPLLIHQNLSSTLFPVLWCHHHAGVIAVRVFALQTSALLPPDRTSSHCQHAASEAQLTLPESRWCYCRTPSNRQRSKGLWGLASGSRKPASRATWRTRRRWDGHQHGKPKRWHRWNY